ncbi:hypothetical protein WV31_04760 [Magnetospirillum sp. ME-1]|uniref:type II toxin-antitoxin system TacA family antitoxin n=1 Tax=Magnetospirillum sp. ME-1 TaxID=1639348 RepID=UPI000A17F179|nr:DUF1778 domain-containing protein [Magnetospirillum sp. ME-1]ARJ65023.1 hypothetical protein WV31_04760 [Magnetospirillum sp. ME-1]
MLAYNDPTATIAERKSARMEQRVKPQVKQTIEQAAAMLGVDVAEFVANEAYRSAESVLARQEITRLTAADREVMLALLRTPPEPTKALVDLMAAPDIEV